VAGETRRPSSRTPARMREAAASAAIASTRPKKRARSADGARSRARRRKLQQEGWLMKREGAKRAACCLQSRKSRPANLDRCMIVPRTAISEQTSTEHAIGRLQPHAKSHRQAQVGQHASTAKAPDGALAGALRRTRRQAPPGTK